MSKLTHFAETSLINLLYIAQDNKLFSRAIGNPNWELVNEFNSDIKSIDHTYDMKNSTPIVFVLLTNGEIYFQRTPYESWIKFESPELDDQTLSMAVLKDEQKYCILYCLSPNNIKSFKIRCDGFSFIESHSVGDVSEIIGAEKGLYYLEKNSTYSYSLHEYSIDEGWQKHNFAINQNMKCTNFDNSLVLNKSRGVVYYPFAQEQTEQILENKTRKFPKALSKVTDLYACNGVVYVTVDNGDIYIGNVSVGWVKLRLPNENKDSQNYDELTPIIEKCTELLIKKQKEIEEYYAKYMNRFRQDFFF